MTLKTSKQVADNYLERVGTQLFDDGHIEQSGILGMKWGVRRTPEQLGQKETGSTTSKKDASKWEEDENQFLKKMVERIDKEAEGIDHADSIRNEEIQKYVEATKNRYTPEERTGFAKEFVKIWDDLDEASYRMRTAKGNKERKAAEANYKEKWGKVETDDGSASETTHLEMRFDQADYWAGHKALTSEGWDTWGNRLGKELAQEKKKKWFGHSLDSLDETQTGQHLAEEFLSQSGILGMKWGIRRSEEQLGRLGGRLARGSKKKAAAPENSTRKKRLSELSDEELNKVIARLQKEKLYKDLVAPQGKASNPVVQKGETIAKKILSAFGVMLASKFADKAGSYLGEKYASPRKVKLDAENANEANRLARKNAKLEEKRQENADWARAKRNESDDRALAKQEAREAKRDAYKELREKGQRMWDGEGG